MKNILIIEDEPSQQQAYKLKLKNKYNLQFAVSQTEALNQIVPNPPDLIILDIMLPGGKNGFDVLQMLKENPKTSYIPVIILTNLDNEQRQTALDCGAAEYFTKTNISPEEIEKLVEKYL